MGQMAAEVESHQEGQKAHQGFLNLPAAVGAGGRQTHRSPVRPRQAPQGHGPRRRQLSLMMHQASAQNRPQYRRVSPSEVMFSGSFWSPPSLALGSSS